MNTMVQKNLHLSFYTKFIECLIVSVAIWNLYNAMLLFPLSIMLPGNSDLIIIFRAANIPILIGGAAFVILYPVWWQRKENKGTINTVRCHAWLRGIIRYWLVLGICNYGFAKILGTQFGHMYAREYSLAKDLSGLDLTWFYFGKYYPFAVIIGLLQVGGATLLLFRRTVFMGIIILLPIMVNIVLIDIFYDIYWDALMNALLFTAGLLYLLLLYRKALVALFLQSLTALSSLWSGWFKYVLRFSAVAYAFVFIYYFTTTRAPAHLVGKWRVDTFIKGKDTVQRNAWLVDSTAWQYIYLESYPRVTLNPNPYVIEAARAQRGTYQFNDQLNKITLSIRSTGNGIATMEFSVRKSDSHHMEWTGPSKWTGVLKRDTMQLQLTKVE